MRTLKKRFDYEKYVERFYAFLDARKLSRTEERNDILRIVFDFDEPFTVDAVDKKLKNQKCHVSKSTLYTTIRLLKEAGLILKHHLPWHAAPVYEKFYDADAHSHVYIEGSKETIEIPNPRIGEIKKELTEKYGLDIVNYTLTVYCKKIK